MSYSTIRLPKLLFHSFLVLVLMNFLALFVHDLINLLFHYRTEKSDTLILIIFLFWLRFALNNQRYQKHTSS